MESPAKRRRIDRSWESDEDDDLSFQPQEASSQRDPGYQLEIERAHADNRFQSAMAHIFEKYGRDFEGVGDEIDMMTGEIVVNNGHLKNMRNEADVGTGMVPGEDEEVEGDEGGLRWEDLLDEDQFESSSHDSSDEDEEETNIIGENEVPGENNEQDEEDRSLHGQRPSSDSMTVPVPLNSGMAQPPLLQTLAQGSFGDMSHDGPPGMLFGGPGQAFGASPLGFGASPLAFGHSPLAFNPWTQHLPQQSMWDGPEIPQQQATANRMAFQPRKKRQSVPSAPTSTSIWTSGTSYEYQLRRRNALGQRRQSQSVVAKKPRPKKHPRPRGSQFGRLAEQEVQDSDEDGSLPSPPRRQPLTESKSQGNDKSPENNPSRVRKKPGPKPGTPRPAGSKKPGPQPGFRRSKDINKPRPKPGSRRRKHRVNDRSFIARIPMRSKRSKSDMVRANEHSQASEAAATEVKMDDQEDIGDRRRSGRERKPVERLSQVVWDPFPWQKIRLVRFAERQAARKAAGLDSASDEDSDGSLCAEDEKADGDQSKAEDHVPKSSKLDKQDFQHRVVPDSQDSITPPTSSIPQTENGKRTAPHVAEPPSQDVADPDSLLSDDEMPMHVLPQRPSSQSDSFTTQVFSLIEPADAQQTEPRRKPGRPGRKSISGPDGATSREGPSASSAEPAPGPQSSTARRKPGRPFGSKTGMRKSMSNLAASGPRRSRRSARFAEGLSTELQLDKDMTDRGPEGTTNHGPLEQDTKESLEPKEMKDANLEAQTSPRIDGQETNEFIVCEGQEADITPVSSEASAALPERMLAVSEKIASLDNEVVDSQGEPGDTVATAGEVTALHAQDSGKIAEDAVPDPETSEAMGTSPGNIAADEAAPLADGHAPLLQEQMNTDAETVPDVHRGTMVVGITAATENHPSAPEVSEAPQPEAHSSPVAASPVIEETDQEPSSAPERFGSPELGSPAADPFDLPPSGTAPPRFSLAKTSVTSPVKSSPLRKAHVPQSGKASPPFKRKSASPTKLTSPSKITKASTPRTPTSHHKSSRRQGTPSSRRSLLSLTRRKADDEDDFDELGAAEAPSSAIALASNRRTSVARRIWKATPRTTEVFPRSPERRQSGKGSEDLQGDVTRTPGGTMRTCGVDGFQCGRDFCFTCL
ncbi:hypothetical protein CC79DRAFT_1361574 [Sarocladium strictum]